MSDERSGEFALCSAEARTVLGKYATPLDLAIDWMLNRLPESAKQAVRRGVAAGGPRRLIEQIDAPEAAADYRDLLDLSQCLAPATDEAADLGVWAACPRPEPPEGFFEELRAFLAPHDLVVPDEASQEAGRLWDRLIGAAAARDYFRLRERLQRLRDTPAGGHSLVEQCVLRDYPELLEEAGPGEFAFSFSLEAFVLRRLHAWCRKHCRAGTPGGSVHARLARWKQADRAAVFELLGVFVAEPAVDLPFIAAEETAWSAEEEAAGSDLVGFGHSPILLVPDAPDLYGALCRLIATARTPVRNDVRRYDRPEGIRDQRVLTAATPCVVVVPGSPDESDLLVDQLRQRLNRPRCIVVLPEDDAVRAWGLLGRGAYDVVWRKGFSLPHLRQAIGHAANGAWRPPYAPIFTDTRDYDPRPDTLPWAIAHIEDVGTGPNQVDYRALRLLPTCLGLKPEALTVQEVLPPLAGAGTARPRTELVLALLSAESRGASDRASFLAAMAALEEQGRRVVYLQRHGAVQRVELSGDRRPTRRLLRYYSAIELLLRLYFGFGGSLPEPNLPLESGNHDSAHRTGV
jgi:hypothetical protein